MNNVDQRSAKRPFVGQPVRPWSLRVIVVLLLLEAIGLIGISVMTSAWISVEQFVHPQVLSLRVTEARFVGGIFGPLGATALIAALALLLRLRLGWLLAMLVQAGTLLTCLRLYLDERPSFIYPLMLCSIITVLYLNSLEVRVAFQAAPVNRSMKSMEVIDEA